MNKNFQSEGIQTSSYSQPAPTASFSSQNNQIYTERKDVMVIKKRLLALIDDPEYWKTLSMFVFGECSKQKYDEMIDVYLTTNELRVLHNELIRSILFNAHFSTVPPPGVPMPKKSLPEHLNQYPKTIQRSKFKLFNSFCASDLRHIPSLEQLARRVSYLTSMKVDNAALELLFYELKKYIIVVLQQCTQVNKNREINNERNVILPSQLQYVLSSNVNLLLKHQNRKS